MTSYENVLFSVTNIPAVGTAQLEQVGMRDMIGNKKMIRCL
jgi:hypothetical protein